MIYYSFIELHRWPHEYLELPVREKAIVAACYAVRVEAEKKANQKARRAAARKKALRRGVNGNHQDGNFPLRRRNRAA